MEEGLVWRVVAPLAIASRSEVVTQEYRVTSGG
jgi:hypothetical protein